MAERRRIPLTRGAPTACATSDRIKMEGFGGRMADAGGRISRRQETRWSGEVCEKCCVEGERCWEERETLSMASMEKGRHVDRELKPRVRGAAAVRGHCGSTADIWECGGQCKSATDMRRGLAGMQECRFDMFCRLWAELPQDRRKWKGDGKKRCISPAGACERCTGRGQRRCRAVSLRGKTGTGDKGGGLMCQKEEAERSRV